MNKINLPQHDAKLFKVKGSTVDFVRYSIDEIEYISFDTSDRGAPEPMQNALIGLNLINNTKTRLVMINHRKPEGLLSKLEGKFQYIEQILDSKDIAIEFFLSDEKKVADLKSIDSNCSG